MTLLRRLADHALAYHPGRAAIVLERLGAEETIRLLERRSVATVGLIVQRLSPQYSNAVLQGLTPDRAAQLLESFPVDTATRFLRRADHASQTAILRHVQPKRARSIQALLRFPQGSAGALMDPDVLALPQELTKETSEPCL